MIRMQGTRGRLALFASCLALIGAAGVAGCGGDDEESSGEEAAVESTESAESVTVTAQEYSFDLSATPTAETTEVIFDNVGEEEHVLVFARINEGFTTEEAIEMMGEKGSATTVVETGAPPGKQTTTEVKKSIEPGEYAMLCPLQSKEGPHYELGQLEEFSIE